MLRYQCTMPTCLTAIDWNTGPCNCVLVVLLRASEASFNYGDGRNRSYSSRVGFYYCLTLDMIV